MVKFENRVVLNKISRLVETTPLIIFLDCRDPAVFHKKKNNYFDRSYNFLQENNDNPKIKNEDFFAFTGGCAFAEGNGVTSGEGNDLRSKVLLVKNKYLEKALFKKSKLLSSSLKEGFVRSLKENICLEKSSLFKGNRLALFYKKYPTKGLSLRQDLLGSKQVYGSVRNLESKNITVLGGVYNNRFIDHNQIKRLVECGDDHQIYLRLNKTLKQSSFLCFSKLYYHSKIFNLLKLMQNKALLDQRSK